MRLSEFKNYLNNVSEINIIQPNGAFVPKHFHITEAGITSKHFVDCGGTLRTEKVMNFQLWNSNDVHHRLEPSKLLKIISAYEKHFGNDDLEIEVEYQNETIGKYGLANNGENLVLLAKKTDCLANDNCSTPKDKNNLVIAEFKTPNEICCSPNAVCC